MSDWQEVASSDEVRAGVPFSVELSEEEEVFLYRDEQGSLTAYGNACTHVGCPVAKGVVHEGMVTCPCHNARFSLSNGGMVAAPALDDLPRYAVREVEGKIWVGERTDPSIEMPAGSDDRHFLIVGAGAAAEAACEQLRREGFAGAITMITPEEAPPYNRTLLSKFFLSQDWPVEKLFLRSAEFYDRLQIDLRMGTGVAAVDPKAKRLTLDDGTTLDGDAILLATGSRARTLPVPGADQPGCYTLRSPADATEIRESASEAENAVVIGGSFIGTEVAAYLTERGVRVSVVTQESVPFERVFGERIGTRVRKLHEENGVRYFPGRTVQRVVGEGGAEGVELDDGTTVPGDFVVIGVGAEPVVDYLEGSGLVRDGAVPVDSRLRTGAEGIYAAGDIARIEEGLWSGARIEHWVVAQRHGQHAARAMLGREEEYGYAPFFWSRQFATSFKYIGYAPDYDDIRFLGDPEGEEFLAGYFRQGRLAAIGGIGMGGESIRLGMLLERGGRLGPEDFEAGRGY